MKRNQLITLLLCLVLLAAGAFTAAAAPPKLVLPKTVKITAGRAATIAVTGMSDGSALPDDVVYAIASKKAAFATVDPATGAVQTKKVGSVTLTASSATLGKKANATCTVKILKNAIVYAKPNKGSGTGVFLSTKSLAYKNGALKGELWVFNRHFKKALEGLHAQSGNQILVAVVDEKDLVRAATTLPNQVALKKRVPMNRAGVLTIQFAPSNTMPIDLRSENFELRLMDSVGIGAYGKGLTDRSVFLRDVR